MASRPGILTDWPWKPLGSFKYVILAPWVIHSSYSVLTKDKNERDISTFLIFPLMLWRMLHNQIWITLSRYRTAKGNARIVDKGIEFDQVDRERDWDDQILFNGFLYYLASYTLAGASHLPIWRTDGVIMTILLHAGPVEFLYYWLHRALHHHFLYSRYHSHHHSSIATEPITSVIHPFAEHISYFLLFAIPMLTQVLSNTASVVSMAGYVTFIDFMNNMGHCNFELLPKWLFNIFPPLKYLMYTPSFHSLHHTQFRTNYSLFMPFYDYIYGTMDKDSDQLHESALKREEETPDVVHLTHLTTPESIYHLRLGFAHLASKPYMSKWYLRLMWPVTAWSMMLTWVYGRTFIVERNRFDKLKLQIWAIPKYSVQYYLEWQKGPINRMIEDAILDADRKGIKVLSLGLMNQGEELNMYGGLYVSKNPNLKVKVVDGSSLAVAVVLNSIPKGTTQVLLKGKLTKVAYAIAFTLCKQGFQVATMHEDDLVKLKKSFNRSESNLIIAKSYTQTTWLVGDGLTEEEQLKAPKGTLFIPYSQFPPKKYRKDCSYHCTPAMLTPSFIENVHSCEDWLPRRVMSAWRIAGIVHSLEGWIEHECGYTMQNIDKVWHSALQHGFQPVPVKELAHY
ncbi:very-long-chain aldehyde decarbonylase CER1-like isoform X3 [Gastrolobium bilobum]|uniref:very-long-chain aldehyde decarbonylase CER1-like isoform X3 n=1 Tax=Gastrolobium bilobum TaxID=150636 RepID=UPI002AB25680|nr:very-long-chain aldehyde decarbonylase CER1-like isoform X3 [Gastrolobium bilobum]